MPTMRGKFTYKIMKNEETGYCVVRYHFYDIDQDVTCIGTNLPMNKFSYDFEVEEINTPKYGRQFKVLSYTESIGKDKNEMIEYMVSSYDGIGKQTAGKIYHEFGSSSLDIIENEPDKLLCIPRMSQKKIDRIIASTKKKQYFKNLYLLLLKYDFSNKLIDKIIHIHKEYAYERIMDNPYILCEIKGIDFSKADQLKDECHIEAYDSKRIAAATIQAMKDDMLLGNCGITKESLLYRENRLLAQDKPLSCKILWHEAVKMIHDGRISYRKVFYDNNIVQYLYINYMHEAEIGFAERIVNLTMQTCTPVENLDDHIREYEQMYGIKLDNTQKEAVMMSFSKQFMLLTGGPGMGKTTLINLICFIYEKLYDASIELLAPTGRAARRMSECSGRNATTIHSRLGLGIRDQNSVYTEEDITPIRDGLLIVDEFSMVDLLLGYKLLLNVQNCKVIFVGDENQLPSVNAGQLLYDLTSCDYIPVARLRFPHRQEAGSTICFNANGMQNGIYDLKEASDFEMYLADNPNLLDMQRLQLIEDKMVDDYLSLWNNQDVTTIACLCPYKKYPAGVYSINKRIQNIINPLNGRKEMKGTNEMTFREGDLVMHLKNEDDTMNGDLGVVKKISFDSDKGLVMDVEYDTYIGKVHMEYTTLNIEDITLAYAITIHKSQGSEYDAVITCITRFHKPMLYLNVLYTAITRGKKHVKLYTDSKDTIKSVVLNRNAKRRNSLLAYNIRVLCEKEFKQLALDLAQ